MRSVVTVAARVVFACLWFGCFACKGYYAGETYQYVTGSDKEGEGRLEQTDFYGAWSMIEAK
ncbi:MAG: hypothetical protein LBG84_09690, partial [Treponema sp.]|nr:hypothetical protein [Treponema sp.]